MRKSVFVHKLERLRLRLGQARRYVRLAIRSLVEPLPAASHERRGASELPARLEEYSAAAESHWQAIQASAGGRVAALEKPFASLRETPAMLYRLGLALEALELGVGQTILDFGAGSCWLSVVLNRLGCRTISLDVSPTALAVGRLALAREVYARPELNPEFVSYDGRHIPLPDESVDRVVCFDAFHHVPNQDEVLAELFRVLRRGGRVVMAEPGDGHAHADASAFETAHYGVLENDLVLEDLFERIRRAGFTDIQAKPYPDVPILILSGQAHLRLLAGDHSLFPMHHVVDSLRQFHLLILRKGEVQRDSRSPARLRAQIGLPDGAIVAGHAGKLASVAVRLENAGDTTWLAAEDRVTGGYVSLGGHLLDSAGRSLRVGHFTQPLPRDVRPGESVDLRATFGLPEQAGRYRLRLDLVADKIAWFSQSGSPTADLALAVEYSDSRDPHRFEARIEPLGAFPPRGDATGFALRLRLTNLGDTTWLSDPPDARGTVRIGVQRLSEDGSVADRDHFRIGLPHRVAPGEAVDVDALVPRPAGAASRFAVDLVAEQICWFETHGSRALAFSLEPPSIATGSGRP